MKIDKNKFMLMKAKKCKGSKDLIESGIPRGTLGRVISGENARPETIGKIARALGCDVTDIIEE